MVKRAVKLCITAAPSDICIDKTISKTTKSVQMKNVFKTIGKQVKNLFRSEEVEVTFTVTGKRVTYTYIKTH